MSEKQVAEFTALYMKAYQTWGDSETLLEAFRRVAFTSPEETVESVSPAQPQNEETVEKETTEAFPEEEEATSAAVADPSVATMKVNSSSIKLGDDGQAPTDTNVGTKKPRRSSVTIRAPPGGASQVEFGAVENGPVKQSGRMSPGGHSNFQLAYDDEVKATKSNRSPAGGKSSFQFAYNDSVKANTDTNRSPAGGQSSFQFAYNDGEGKKQPKPNRSPAGGQSSFQFAYDDKPQKPVNSGRSPAGGKSNFKFSEAPQEPSKKESNRSPAGGKSSFQFAYDTSNSEKSSIKLHHAPGGQTSIVLGTDGLKKKSAMGSTVPAPVMESLIKTIYARGSKLRSVFQEFLGGQTSSKFVTKSAFLDGLKNMGYQMKEEHVDILFKRYSKNGGLNYSSFVRMLSLR